MCCVLSQIIHVDSRRQNLSINSYETAFEVVRISFVTFSISLCVRLWFYKNFHAQSDFLSCIWTQSNDERKIQFVSSYLNIDDWLRHEVEIFRFSPIHRPTHRHSYIYLTKYLTEPNHSPDDRNEKRTTCLFILFKVNKHGSASSSSSMEREMYFTFELVMLNVCCWRYIS